jgi:TonB family protein
MEMIALYAEKPMGNGIFVGRLEPKFRGDFSAFLKRNIQYPIDAKRDKIEGTVLLYCKFDKEGKIDSPIVIQYVSSSIDAEAIRIVKLMPNWEPAKLNDKPIAFWCTVKIPFKL